MSTRTASPMLRPQTCATCPFRGGFHLDHRRRAEIHQGVMVGDSAFQCHSEIDYTDEDGEHHPGNWDARQCAGATTLALRDGGGNQVMRLQERLGGSAPVEDPSVPFESWAEWVNEPEYSLGRRGDVGTGEACHVVGPECEEPAGWMGGTGAVANEAANAEHACVRCGEPTCSACMGDEWCTDCEENER